MTGRAIRYAFLFSLPCWAGAVFAYYVSGFIT